MDGHKTALHTFFGGLIYSIIYEFVLWKLPLLETTWYVELGTRASGM